MSYTLKFTKQAEKDLSLIKASPIKSKAYKILAALRDNPYSTPYEKLTGNLAGFYLGG